MLKNLYRDSISMSCKYFTCGTVGYRIKKNNGLHKNQFTSLVFAVINS